MYVIASHIPVYIEGSTFYTDRSWQRDLILARDWLASPFGGLQVLCPSLPLSERGRKAGNSLERVGGDDGIRVLPSFDYRCRARAFWTRPRRQWLLDVSQALRHATVLHVSASADMFKPLCFLAYHVAAHLPHVTKVFVGPDMDPHLVLDSSLRSKLICWTFDHYMKRAVRGADLALLKEGSVYDRYKGDGDRVRAFCHSMHRCEDVVTEETLTQRLHGLGNDRPLRAAYAGRFVERKGLRLAVSAVAEAKRQGISVEYHLFGGGPEEQRLREQVQESGLRESVQFHGVIEYGPELIRRLAQYDVLLFMPTEEDTPRMIYDGMAAALPVVGTRIPFLVHRVESDHAGTLVNMGDVGGMARRLIELDSGRSRLACLSVAARAAGIRHSVETWYGRRAEWTKEAVERCGTSVTK